MDKSRIINVLETNLEVMKLDLEASGPCEHFINICVCGTMRAIEDTKELINELKKELVIHEANGKNRNS